MRSLLLYTFFLSFSASSEVLHTDSAWERYSDPHIMSPRFNRTYSRLPLEGKVREERKYWSGDYWALKKGSISYRWNASRPTGFNYVSPSKQVAFRLSWKELSSLSPAEKFDLFLGAYTYPLKREVQGSASPDRKAWEGICHGWAPAIMHHNEPLPKTVRNTDGLEIPFGSSDIKALLSYYYANKYKPATNHLMGSRCERVWWPWASERCKEDLNAGAFHIVLTNRIGLQGMSFVADLKNQAAVSNHVPVSYKIKVQDENLPPESNSAPGTVRTVRLEAEVLFVFNGKNTWDPVLRTREQVIKKRNYTYTLDLSAHDEIIGGNWKSMRRPDFLWLIDKAPRFEGKWERLAELLND